MMAPAGPSSARKRAERAGRRAEILAAASYLLRGYQILEWRYKARGGEIDLIAKRKDLLVFAEVKARAARDTAIEAVTGRNRRRVEQAGHTYLSRNPAFSEHGVRYDIIAVTGWRARHIADAWREGE